MRTTRVDKETGDVRCPKCGANSFITKRTVKGKLMGATMGGVGIALMPKRLKCMGCGKNLKFGGVDL
jgi:DNA-directed RNA polymerase subunit RPC12/RpoP